MLWNQQIMATPKLLSIKTLTQKLTGILYNNNGISNSKRMVSHFTYTADEKPPIDGPTTKLNMFQAINNAMDLALERDETALVFGEDVAFGGVFRCSLNLQVNTKIIKGIILNFDTPKLTLKYIVLEKIWSRSCI